MAPVLHPIEHALHNVAGLVELGVVFELHLSVLARRDAGRGLDVVQPVAQVDCVISPVRDDGGSLADIPFKALTCLRNIGSIARRQMQMDRAAMPVADQMKLAVQPALGLADGPPTAFVFLTPFAAMRWVLMWLASIIRVPRSVPSRARASKIRSNTPASDQRL